MRKPALNKCNDLLDLIVKRRAIDRVFLESVSEIKTIINTEYEKSIGREVNRQNMSIEKNKDKYEKLEEYKIMASLEDGGIHLVKDLATFNKFKLAHKAIRVFQKHKKFSVRKVNKNNFIIMRNK